MLFAFVCKDKPGSLQLRMDTRPEHVAFLTKLNEAGTLKFAGPFLDADGKPNGSLVVVEASRCGCRRCYQRRRPLCQGRAVRERRDPAVDLDLQQPGQC